jgi:hypothetical protein
MKEIKNPHQIIHALLNSLENELLCARDDESFFWANLIERMSQAVGHEELDRIERILNGVIFEFSPTISILTDQQKLEALEPILKSIVASISLQPTFEQAKSEFTQLDHVISLAARLAFSGDAKLNEDWYKIINDFEHADEDIVIRSIFNDIQNRSYIFE